MTQSNEKRIKRLVDNYNQYVAKAVAECGTREIFLDKSSTCISAPEEVEDATIIIRRKWATVNIQGLPLLIDYNREWCIEELKDTIKYYKHCIKNGVKYYKSKNPDAFLEQEDEDEED